MFELQLSADKIISDLIRDYFNKVSLFAHHRQSTNTLPAMTRKHLFPVSRRKFLGEEGYILAGEKVKLVEV